MSKWLALTVITVLASALASGCNYGNGAFACSTSAECTGAPGGTCEPGFGLCSFPTSDPSCPSGRKFGDLSGDQSGQCVGGQLPMVDAAVDAKMVDARMIDAPPDALVCYGTGIVKVCFASAPTQALVLADQLAQTLDTGIPATCATTVTGGDGYCVLVATTITINGPLRATGTKPLVLIASNSIAIIGDGELDAGSHRTRAPGTPETGPGADSDATICMAGTAATNHGGGAGGSFTGKGGIGGTGAAGSTGGAPGNAVTLPISSVRGGCPGQEGQGTSGSGGHGGGAVYLIAGTKIELAGGISAGGEAGAGGTQGPNGGGGGGGGAGGMIGLDAPAIVISGQATLVANGGGGGEGGAGGIAQSGGNGTDAVTTGAASGGQTQNLTSGGDGGNGSAGAAAGAGAVGNPGMSVNGGPIGGGGGGGGGAGLIIAPAGNNIGAKASPATTAP